MSDPWASLKNLGTEETLPTSDGNVGESSEDVKSVSRETAADSKEPEMHSRVWRMAMAFGPLIQLCFSCCALYACQMQL